VHAIGESILEPQGGLCGKEGEVTRFADNKEDKPMVYEMRVYTLQPGKVPAFLELIEKEALPVISKYSKLVGFWSTEVGALNEVVHIWAYEDPNHRERARKAQGEDPQLQAFRPKAQAMIVSQYNKILVPASFSPLK
jgi:hypothetical protein